MKFLNSISHSDEMGVKIMGIGFYLNWELSFLIMWAEENEDAKKLKSFSNKIECPACGKICSLAREKFEKHKSKCQDYLNAKASSSIAMASYVSNTRKRKMIMPAKLPRRLAKQQLFRLQALRKSRRKALKLLNLNRYSTKI